MLQFISENLPTIIIGAVVLAIVVLALVKILRDKKNHKSSCGCGCDGCPMSDDCHK